MKEEVLWGESPDWLRLSVHSRNPLVSTERNGGAFSLPSKWTSSYVNLREIQARWMSLDELLTDPVDGKATQRTILLLFHYVKKLSLDKERVLDVPPKISLHECRTTRIAWAMEIWFWIYLMRNVWARFEIWLWLLFLNSSLLEDFKDLTRVMFLS